jgi:hypothetical protein
MDGHDTNHRLVAGFLAGELGPADARRWDEHLLECEQCWRAVREDRAGRQAAELLRRPAPAGLADRVAFTVEVAAASGPAARPQGRPGRRQAWWRLAGAATLAAGLAVTLLMVLLPGGRQTGSMPAAVAAVARYAQAVPPPAREQPAHPGGPAAPVQVGRPVTVTVGGQQILMRTWRLGGTEAVVAVSGQPFPMPPGAASMSGAGMAWFARLGKLGLYCLNGHQPELVAAPVPMTELATLAARLPPG